MHPVSYTIIWYGDLWISLHIYHVIMGLEMSRGNEHDLFSSRGKDFDVWHSSFFTSRQLEIMNYDEPNQENGPCLPPHHIPVQAWYLRREPPGSTSIIFSNPCTHQRHGEQHQKKLMAEMCGLLENKNKSYYKGPFPSRSRYPYPRGLPSP